MSAFVVMPWTGIAPFSNVRALGRLVDASASAPRSRRNGTVMSSRIGLLGASCRYRDRAALTSNWFRPRRRSTSAVHVAVASAVTLYGSRPGRGDRDRRARRASSRAACRSVAASSTSITAVAGSVTAIVGGFAKRSSWTPRYAAEGEDADGQQGDDDEARRERQALARRRDRPRHGDDRGGLTLASPRSRRHWGRTSSGSSPR